MNLDKMMDEIFTALAISSEFALNLFLMFFLIVLSPIWIVPYIINKKNQSKKDYIV
jgi:hypothetical protein